MMKNRQNENFKISPEFSLKTIVKVEGLSNYDMIYIYHHLKTGSPIRLVFLEEKLNGERQFTVYYKSFKLGHVTFGKIFNGIYGKREEMDATIKSVNKEKYLPLKGMDIQVNSIALKKVS